MHSPHITRYLYSGTSCHCHISHNLSDQVLFTAKRNKNKIKKNKNRITPWKREKLHSRENYSKHKHADCKNMAVFFLLTFYNLHFHNMKCKDHVILDLVVDILHTIWIRLQWCQLRSRQSWNTTFLFFLLNLKLIEFYFYLSAHELVYNSHMSTLNVCFKN